jgi:phosphoribosylaminoimidazole (AIR) synthetase
MGNMKRRKMSDRLKAYARAGVDVDLGNKVKAGLPALVKSAGDRPEVLGKVGGFGGLFSARFPKMRDPFSSPASTASAPRSRWPCS